MNFKPFLPKALTISLLTFLGACSTNDDILDSNYVSQNAPLVTNDDATDLSSFIKRYSIDVSSLEDGLNNFSFTIDELEQEILDKSDVQFFLKYSESQMPGVLQIPDIDKENNRKYHAEASVKEITLFITGLNDIDANAGWIPDIYDELVVVLIPNENSEINASKTTVK
ncbi:MAG: hypothetical protein AAGD88_03215 [Bacteroidota bacterium]